MMMKRAVVVAWVAGAAAGCVPRGDPPPGRQLVADRISVPVAVLAPTGDGTTRVLVTRPGPIAKSADLYMSSVDAAGSAPVEQLLAANFLGECGTAGTCVGVDARGRLLVYTAVGDYEQGNGHVILARIDPVSGERTDLAMDRYYQFSPGHQRLLLRPNSFSGPSEAAAGPATLYDADDRATTVDSGSDPPWFLGEDLYYVDPNQDLVRIQPGGTPEVVATGVTQAGSRFGGNPSFIWIGRGSDPDPTKRTVTLFDPVTLKETPCPPLGFCDVSPTGQWLAASPEVSPTSADRNQTITFTNRLTGVEDQFTASGVFSDFAWRAGRDELWMTVDSFAPDYATSIWVKAPGVDPVQVPASVGNLYRGVEAGSSFNGSYQYSGPFSPDGAYWFSLTTVLPSHQTLCQVGSVDDLTAPLIPLVPPTTNAGTAWALDDGRILTPAYATTNDRANMYVVDPATGDTRVIGEDGVLLGIGHSRLVVNQHHIQNAGDLTVFDLGTGRGTVIAPEFAITALVEKRGDDAVAPGAPIVFQFLARFPSPYDGIWLAEVP
jgi:hypothetical protein